MPEGVTTEDLLSNIKDSIMDNIKDSGTKDLINNIADSLTNSDSNSKPKSVSFFEDDKSESVSAQFNRLFGREKPLHHILGGGKSADVLLWRNKKISAGVLAGATVVWILFQWLNYNFLSLICFGLVIFMVGQKLWYNCTSRSSTKVARVVVPEELFVNIAKTIGMEVNRGVAFLQDVSCKGTMKQFAVVVGSLLTAAIISSWCNFFTVIYIGFIGAHTLPVVYEKYDVQIDAFVYNLLHRFQQQFNQLDKSVLTKLGSFKGKKGE